MYHIVIIFHVSYTTGGVPIPKNGKGVGNGRLLALERPAVKVADLLRGDTGDAVRGRGGVGVDPSDAGYNRVTGTVGGGGSGSVLTSQTARERSELARVNARKGALESAASGI